MKRLTTLMLIVLCPLVFGASPENLPPVLLGTWTVGTPYDAHQPVGLDARQEAHIRTLHLRYTQTHLHVCGKNISIRSVKVEPLTQDAFMTKYSFQPIIIGLTGDQILEVYLNFPHSTDACGEGEDDPGTHIFIGGDNHVVMEVANDYFPLKKG